MRRFFPLILVGLIASVIVAYAASPGVINQYNALCGANTPSYCAQPDSSGNLPVTGTISGTVSSGATATVAAPSYSEGVSNPLSQTLVGNLRTTGVGGTFPVTIASLPALPSNQSVNVAQVNGGTVATGSGAMNAQTQRTALATDSPGIITTGTAGSASTQVLTVQGIASMTKLLVTPDSVALPANQSVNVAQINGITPLMGAGNTGTGSPRVTISTDQAALAGVGAGATGAAPPANAVQLGGVASGATGGLTAGLKTCDLHAKYDASDNGNITLVTGVSGRKVYVCGYILANGGTATNLSLTEGSDANCATNNAGLTPVYQVLANQSIGIMSPFWTGLAVSTNAYFVCIKSSAGNAHQGEIWYTIQ